MGDCNEVINLQSRPSLDAGAKFETQIKILNAHQGAEVQELAFREESVKDVSDKGRENAATFLQEALEAALGASTVEKKAMMLENGGVIKPKKLPSTTAAPQANVARDARIREEILQLMTKLRELAQGPDAQTRSAGALKVLKILEKMPVSCFVLKATKIAAELNLPAWKGLDVSQEVRDLRGSLVKGWRDMYRFAEGTTQPEPVTSPALARRRRNLTMDLEENVYCGAQKVSKYQDLVTQVGHKLRREPEQASLLLAGGGNVRDFVVAARDEIKRNDALKRSHAIENGNSAKALRRY